MLLGANKHGNQPEASPAECCYVCLPCWLLQAKWHGTDVAVKVMRLMGPDAEEVSQQHAEVAMR